MAVKKRSTKKSVASRLTQGGLMLMFTDAASRHCIASYASMIGRRNPELAQRLLAMVEEAGGLDSTDLEAATAPEREDNAD